MMKYEIVKPKAILSSGNHTATECISLFEQGTECIYFVDKLGKYAWTCLDKKEMKHYLARVQKDRNAQAKLGEAKIAFVDADWQGLDKEVLQQKIDSCQATEDADEVLLLKPSGEIAAIARQRKLSTGGQLPLGHPDVDLTLLQGRHIYVTTDRNEDLKGFMDFYKEHHHIELLDDSKFIELLNGNTDALLVYAGEDIYPAINKVSIGEINELLLIENRYKKNISSMSAYEGFKLKLTVIPKTVEIKFTIASRMKEFLSQIDAEKPIFLEDAYDLEELCWMCSKLRSSDRFGTDNRLFLAYTSAEQFQNTLKTLDWWKIIETGKVVMFLKAESEKIYLSEAEEHQNPKPLHIDEINEIIYTSINGMQQGASGSDFFNMILDYHPDLLTIGYHGLPFFGAIYDIFLRNMPAGEAIEKMESPASVQEKKIIEEQMKASLSKDYDSRIGPFFEALKRCMDMNRSYSEFEWFKAFFLAANNAVGREFTHRIAPAILYDYHDGYAPTARHYEYTHRLTGIKDEIYKKFTYKKQIACVRNKTSRLGSFVNMTMRSHNENDSTPYRYLEYFTKNDTTPYMKKDYDTKSISAVRFEDLKLHPQETLHSLCDFLRLRWSDTLLEITVNGDDGGKVDGTRGWDVGPVYKNHEEFMSKLDYYRMELLNEVDFKNYGYTLRYYDGQKFTLDELKHLMSLPFKMESMKLTNYPHWPDKKIIKEFHDFIWQTALDLYKNGPKKHVDNDGNELIPLDYIRPCAMAGEVKETLRKNSPKALKSELNSVLKDMQIACVDIKNHGKDNDLMILENKDVTHTNIASPMWFKNEEGQGYVVTGNNNKIELKIKSVKKGILKINLRGKYVKGNLDGKALPYLVNFTSFCVNGDEQLSGPMMCWRNKPFVWSKSVMDGEEMTISVKWSEIGEYTKAASEILLDRFSELI